AGFILVDERPEKSIRKSATRKSMRQILGLESKSHFRILRFSFLAAAVLIVPIANAQTTVQAGTDPTKFVLKGVIVNPDGVLNGELVIENDAITCAAAACSEPAGAAVITVSNAYIFPGFIDAHNHVAYNFLPKWNPPKVYERRAQWQSSTSYETFKTPYDILKKTLFCEMVKYGELKALLSGVTTIEGTSPGSKCIGVLIRNAENQNHLATPSSFIRTYILDISSFRETID